MSTAAHLLRLIQALSSVRARLALENVALEQQILVLRRTRIYDSHRAFWFLIRRMLKRWEQALFIVKPGTVIRWHRNGFRSSWRYRSKAKPGRPSIERKLIHLTKRLSRENPLSDAPRIQNELALLGHEAWAKYMTEAPRSSPGTWKQFIARYMTVTAACDFFVVPTLTFRRLNCVVVLGHDRRRILLVNVTKHPTAEWTAQELLEAFPCDTATPRCFIRDRDAIYREAVQRKFEALGIEQVATAPKMAMICAYVERVIGTLCGECTDHIIPLAEQHLLQTLREHVAHYNEVRPHWSLGGNSPLRRRVDAGASEITATPILSGLNHTYRPAA